MNAIERRRLTKARMRRARPPIIATLEHLDVNTVELKVLPGSVTYVPAGELQLRVMRPPRYLRRSG